MFRSYSAASLAAAYGAVSIADIHARCVEAQLPLPSLAAVGVVATIVAFAWFITMALWDGQIPFPGGSWRSSLAAFLAAAYGAVAIGPVRELFLDAMVPAPEWLAVTFLAWSAAIACLLIMLCRPPVEVVEIREVVVAEKPRSMGRVSLTPGTIEYLAPGEVASLSACHSPSPIGSAAAVSTLNIRLLEATVRLAEAKARQAEFEAPPDLRAA